MPSKKSKTRQTALAFRSKVEHACSEARVAGLAGQLGQALKPGDRVFLEGELGAGKSTFARYLLDAFEIERPPEGSPTFAIAHEYRARQFPVAHVDLYRLKSEEEIEQAGLEGYFWNWEGVVIVEWMSLFPCFKQSVLESARSTQSVYQITISFETDPALRTIQIQVE